MEIRCERWEVTPLAPPRFIRHCRGCNAMRPFFCTETFRVNAHRKRLDVWLNYRCERCDATWKCPVIERRSVADIDKHTLEAFFRDDPLVARRFAFDIAHARKQRAPVDAGTDVRVQRVCVVSAGDDVAPLCIRLVVALPCAVRLDRLLAQQLELSRATLQALDARGDVCVSPTRSGALRAAIHDGQCIRFRVRPLLS